MIAAAAGPSSRRLRSLWEMLEINAGAFVDAVSRISALQMTLQQIDLNKGHLPADALAGLQPIHSWVVQSANELRNQCVILDANTTIAAIDRLLRYMEATPKNFHRTAQSIMMQISATISDELNGRFLLSLTRLEIEYFSRSRNGWEEIIDRFPDTILDIEEMSKCFALGRYASSVFHSLQIVEVGLIELGNLIGAKDHKAGWNATLAQLQKIRSTKHPDRTPFQQANAGFVEQICGTTEILMQAWRNKVSHAQGKLILLTADFSAAIAEEIIIASRGFMRRLATEAPMESDPDV